MVPLPRAVRRVPADPRRRTAARLRVRAAEWFRDHDQIEDAVELAIAADDQALVASLLEEHHLELSRSGRSATVDRWIAALPRDLLAARPGVLAAGRAGRERQRDRARRGAPPARARRPGQDRRPRPLDALPRGRAAAAERGLRRRLRARAAAAAAEQALALARTHATELVVPAMAARAYTLLLLGRARGRRTRWPTPRSSTSPPATARTAASARWPRARWSPPVERRPTVADALAERALRRPPARTSPPTSRPPSPTSRPPRPPSSTATRRGPSARLRRALAIRATLEGGALHAWLTARAGRGPRRPRPADRRPSARSTRPASCSPAAPTPACVAAHVAAAAAHRWIACAPTPNAPREPLTNAELAVLRRFDDDRSTAEIAADLYLSRNTVKTHIRSIYRKLGVASRADARARAETLGLLASPG